LRSTEDTEVEIASTGGNEYLTARLELCRERDALAWGRPEGCACLGVGLYYIQGLRTFCSCPEGDDAITAWLEHCRQDEQVRQDHVWKNSGIPKRYRRFTFDGVPEGLSEIAARLKEAAARVDQTSWFFSGPFGVGKTGLAISYARGALSAGAVVGVAFTTAPDLFSRLRSTYGRNNDGETEWDVVQEYTTGDLLVLDDLGAEAISATGRDWLEDRLYQIIGKRHAEARRTLFTSNLDLDELASRIGERVTWRIVEMCGDDHIVRVEGPNLRAS
jgi:DNA replication protein DnaC